MHAAARRTEYAPNLVDIVPPKDVADETALNPQLDLFPRAPASVSNSECP